MRPVSRWAGAVALVAMAAGSAGAQSWTLQLTPGQEAPTVPSFTNELTGGPRPASFGTAVFTLTGSGASLALAMTATVTNIDFGGQTPYANDDVLAAHIHASADPVAAARPVVWGFIGTPFNNNNPNDGSITPFGTGLVGATVTATWNAPEGNNTTLLAQLDNLLAGRAYVNFHTTQNPGGEIRGNFTAVVPTAVVPEPSTYGLLASGLAGVGLLARRRRA